MVSSGRSTLSRLLDRITGTSGRGEFYEYKEKRHYYKDGSALKSLALCNGTLYGGCISAACVMRCVPLRRFRPDDGPDAGLFDTAIETHDAAVQAFEARHGMIRLFEGDNEDRVWIDRPSAIANCVDVFGVAHLSHALHPAPHHIHAHHTISR